MILYYIYFEGRERNICRDCIDELVCVWGGGNSDKLKKLGESTVSETV